MSQDTFNRIRDKLLEKARKDAECIIEDARREADKIIKKAEEDWRKKVEELRRRILEDARRRAEEVLVDARIKAHMRISNEKDNIIRLLLHRTEELIEKGSFNRRESLKKLAVEAISQLGLKEIVVYVARSDKKLMEELRTSIENELGVKISDIKEADIKGGVIVESPDGTIRIDNSYDTRLEATRTRLLPQVSKELFSGE